MYSETEPTTEEIEAGRQDQAEMLEARVSGKGIVTSSEAEALKDLLKTISGTENP